MTREVTNIYIDESRIDNPNNDYMVIGALFIERSYIPELKRDLKEIQNQFGINSEIKWNRTDKAKLEGYKRIIDRLFEEGQDSINFHCMVVDKRTINYEYFQQDKELAFFRFIYHLLRKRLKGGNDYYIFLDFKPTKLKERVARLNTQLNQFIYFELNNLTHIKKMQAYDSKDNLFIQLADLLAGAVGYHYNEYPQGAVKDELARYIAQKIGRGDSLKFESHWSDVKFNIFNFKVNG